MDQEQSTSYTRPDTPSDDSENNQERRYIPRKSVKKNLISDPASTVDCATCGQWVAHHELFGNPCCKKNYTA